MTEKKIAQHEIVCALKELAIELGRTPTPEEFTLQSKFTKEQIRTAFKTAGGSNASFAVIVQAAGLDPLGAGVLTDPDKTLKLFRRLCSKRERIQGFFRSTIDLKLMFERAGNPPSLKLSSMPDTHVENMDVPAFNCYLEFLKWYDPHAHMIGGDFPDCGGISHWPSDELRPKRLIPEIVQSRNVLDRIVEATPRARTRIYLKGNHEAWIDQALLTMPELFDGLQELGLDITLAKLLKLDHYGYQLFPLNELVQIGNSHHTHGIFTGNNHAKKHLDTFKCNIYYNHLHDNQTTNQTSIYGNLESATGGCLCRLDAKFLKGKPNNWVHGHTCFEFFPDGTFMRYFVPIFNGKTSFLGKVFDGNGKPDPRVKYD